jgi:hypothetical protein
MKKSMIFIAIGSFELATVYSLNHFINLPDFIFGLGCGIGIGLELFGSVLCLIKHDDSVMPNWKRKLYKKLIN